MHGLDNAVWNALTTRHAGFAQAFDQARRFVPEVSSIAALLEPSDRGYQSLAELVTAGQSVNLALAQPFQPRSGWDLVLGTPMPQMVYMGNGLASPTPSDDRIVELGSSDIPDMMELTNLTKPGPFSKRTHELGRYLGIRRDGILIAMAGERLKVPGYTEVSAVCTRPGYTGRGYAQLLTTEIMRGILARGETPFLHVREENVRAIALYERMGFRRRILLHLAVLRRHST